MRLNSLTCIEQKIDSWFKFQWMFLRRAALTDGDNARGTKKNHLVGWMLSGVEEWSKAKFQIDRKLGEGKRDERNQTSTSYTMDKRERVKDIERSWIIVVITSSQSKIFDPNKLKLLFPISKYLTMNGWRLKMCTSQLERERRQRRAEMGCEWESLRCYWKVVHW